MSQALKARGVDATPEQLEFFEKSVRPLLIEHCFECHSHTSKKLQANLYLDSRQGWLRGGDSGAAMIEKDPEASLAIHAIRYESMEMPPKGKLPASKISIIEKWIAMGSPWPNEPSPDAISTQPEFDIEARKASHWVWRPIAIPPVPEVVDETWPQCDIDRFILASLEKEHLKPSPAADRATLIRRLYFDLIGLPPSPDQLSQAVAPETSLDKVVDELLDSPHFGERWGRHWLDLMRYAESRGHEFDNDAQNAYQYRDYVIRAFNADVPYHQLVVEHIAGDLLENPRRHPEQGFNESILGTGFWFLGEWVHSPVDIRKDESDRFDNMIDVMSKAFLGLTVACARCHDHKFDAISTADYYALSGFLQSSDYRQARFETMLDDQRIAEELVRVDQRYRGQIQAMLSEIEPLRLIQQRVIELANHRPELDRVMVDYSDLPSCEFRQDGFIFGSGPHRAGEINLDLLASEPTLRLHPQSAAASDLFWNGIRSETEKGVHSKSSLAKLPHSGRTLRSPTFLVESGDIVCRVSGEGTIVACVDSHRLVAGPLHDETIVPVDAKKRWTRLKLQRYAGHRVHLEFIPSDHRQLEVHFVLENPTGKALLQIEDWEASSSRLVAEFDRTLRDFLAERTSQKDQLFATLGAWSLERKKMAASIRKQSKLAMAMMDGTGEDDHILIRGSSSNPGQSVPRRFLNAVTGDEPWVIPSGSGRLALANAILAPTNPTTSRVIVNRIWHHLMGRGIVPTTDDFGVLGQRPSHPELLDYLACHFVKEGQSIKKLIRSIVLSRTYQMSHHSSDDALHQDPKNLLWHFRPAKRLDGETIRDSLLSVSGNLDRAMYGEPIPMYLTDFMDGRGRPKDSGPIHGEYRRSIYVAVRRNFLSPFMLAFDAPIPFSSMGRRNVSNVPAQALILMNDPFVAGLAKDWAKVAQDRYPESDTNRLEWMFLSAFARQPRPEEVQAIRDYIVDEVHERHVDGNSLELWTDIAHSLFNTKEFIFIP